MRISRKGLRRGTSDERSTIATASQGARATFDTPVRPDFVTVAVLAKDAAHTLPLFLDCISKLRYPKDRLRLYVRTNNNNDATAALLEDWLDRFGCEYADVHFDASDVEIPVEQYRPHEWNSERFKVLGAIRQRSMQWAHERNSHYFVVDCDNFVRPDALCAPMATGLPIVAPLLTTGTAYSNYHEAIDEAGYLAQGPLYFPLLRREIRGLIEVPVVHCTYFVRHEVLPHLSYDDGSGRHEYVIFSDSARKQGIPQYLDNRKVYGHMTFAESATEMEAEPWYGAFTGSSHAR